jgi:peptidoglycan L-alanyl-D-glutamate endopeptidase CwlK
VSFVLGKKSIDNEQGVHPVLVAIVNRAIQTTTQDFLVYEGVRTIERQKALVAARASKTMDSAHIPHADLLGSGAGVVGHAVDLVPFIDNQPRWEWGAIYPIAAAMVNAAFELGHQHQLTWGSYWGKTVADWGHAGFTDANAKAAVLAYEDYHAGPDFVDGPHWQIGRLT